MNHLVFHLVKLHLLLLVPQILGQNFNSNTIARLRIYENATTGTVISPDIRIPLGISQNSQVRLGPGTLKSFVNLNNDTGELILIKMLDLESTVLCEADQSCCRSAIENANDFRRININNLVDEEPTCFLSAYVVGNVLGSDNSMMIGTIQLFIQDVNDNIPRFIPKPSDHQRSPSEPYTISIPEATAQIQSIELPLASDLDFSPSFRIVNYLLEWDDTPYSEYTKKSFPSQDHNIHSSNLKIKNLGPFRLVYNEDKPSLFLELNSPLDRETVSEYKLRLICEDGGKKQASMPLLIKVTDYNEFEPVFKEDANVNIVLDSSNNQIWKFKFDETIPVGSELVRFEAEDKDSPPHNLLEYKIGSATPSASSETTFLLDSRTGFLKLRRELDFESVNLYRLKILAIDEAGINLERSKIRKTASVDVEIEVLDKNDNKPLIILENGDSSERKYSEVWIKENSPPSSAVTFFAVTDRDLGVNGQVNCKLLNWTENFRLSLFDKLHSIETISVLDREVQDKYPITIECQDRGSPPLVSHSTLLIRISDENDQIPKFPLPLYKFHITEDSPTGSILLPMGKEHSNMIQALDLDLKPNLSYQIRPGIGAIPLSNGKIESVPQTGYQFFEYKFPDHVLVTNAELDREMQSEMGFKLCVDDGIHTACTNVIVYIDDVNDNAPRFLRDTYVYRIVENEFKNGHIEEFEIEDPDLENGDLKFDIIIPEGTDSVAAKSINSSFVIRGNKLFMKSSLDREKMSHYHFYVSVRDSKLKVNQKHVANEQFYDNYGPKIPKNLGVAMAEIFIDVSDVNDCQPIFIFPNATTDRGNRLNVSCHETEGSEVGHLEANDLDLGINGTIIYSIKSSNDNIFYLDNRTGALYTTNSRNLLERCGSKIQLLVSVDDLGPESSKKGRKPSIESLFIAIQDQPTLAEFRKISDEAQGFRKEGSEDGDTFPTKAILSIVLGGSTIFLISLLIIWVVLLTYHRTKRRGLRNNVCPLTSRPMTPSNFDPSVPSTLIYGTLKSNKFTYGQKSDTLDAAKNGSIAYSMDPDNLMGCNLIFQPLSDYYSQIQQRSPVHRGTLGSTEIIGRRTPYLTIPQGNKIALIKTEKTGFPTDFLTTEGSVASCSSGNANSNNFLALNSDNTPYTILDRSEFNNMDTYRALKTPCTTTYTGLTSFNGADVMVMNPDRVSSTKKRISVDPTIKCDQNWMFLTPPALKKALNNGVAELHRNILSPNADTHLNETNKSSTYATLSRKTQSRSQIMEAEVTSEDGSSGMGSQEPNGISDSRDFVNLRQDSMNSCV